jgi:hypothetical protein
MPASDLRVGHARCSHLTQELKAPLDALAAHGIPHEKIFAEKVSTRVRVRPTFEAALDACRQIRAHAPHCRVILTVYEMKRLGRDSADPSGPDHPDGQAQRTEPERGQHLPGAGRARRATGVPGGGPTGPRRLRRP